MDRASCDDTAARSRDSPNSTSEFEPDHHKIHPHETCSLSIRSDSTTSPLTDTWLPVSRSYLRFLQAGISVSSLVGRDDCGRKRRRDVSYRTQTARASPGSRRWSWSATRRAFRSSRHLITDGVRMVLRGVGVWEAQVDDKPTRAEGAEKFALRSSPISLAGLSVFSIWVSSFRRLPVIGGEDAHTYMFSPVFSTSLAPGGTSPGGTRVSTSAMWPVALTYLKLFPSHFQLPIRNEKCSDGWDLKDLCRSRS